MTRKLRYILLALLVTATPQLKAETLSLDDCISLALSNNPNVAAASIGIEIAEANYRSARANYFPSVNASLTGGWSHASGSLDIPGGNIPVYTISPQGIPTPTGAFTPFPGISLGYKVGFIFNGIVDVTQPIYMGGRIKAAVAATSEARTLANEDTRRAKTATTIEVTKAYADYVRAMKMQEIAKAYVDLVDELSSNVESAVKHGLRHNNDMMKVNVRRSDAALAQLRADNAVRLARMNLCRVIGLPLTADISVSGEFPEIEIPATCADAEDAVAARPEWQMLQSKNRMLEQSVKIAKAEMLPEVGVKAAYAYTHGFQVNNETFFKDGGAFGVLLNVKIPIYHFGERSNKVAAKRAALQQSRIETENASQLMQLQLLQAHSSLTEADAALSMSRVALDQATENMRLSHVMLNEGMEPLSDYLEAQLLWHQASEQLVTAGFNRFNAFIAYAQATGTLLTLYPTK